MTRQPPREFPELFERYHADVWRYLRTMGCRAHEADDLAQETFVEFFQANFKYRSERATLAYLRRVARSQLLMARRADKGLNVPIDDAGDLPDPGEINADADRRTEILRECVSRLPPKYREALRLRFERGLTRSEIARRVKLSEEGVKSRLRRAFEKLQACMKERLTGRSEHGAEKRTGPAPEF